MKKPNRLVFLFIGILLLTGCASTELRLYLDLYKEDPFPYATLNDTQIARMYQGLQTVQKEADSFAKDRIKLAENLLAVYEELYYLASKAQRPDFTKEASKIETAGYHGYLDGYKKAVTAKAGEVISLCKQARSKLDAYVVATTLKAASENETRSSEKSGGGDPQAASIVNKTDVIESVKEVSRAFVELGGPLETNFEKTLLKNWESFPKMASAQNLASIFDEEPKELDELRPKIQALNKTVKELHQRGRSVPEELGKNLTEAAKALDDPKPGAEGIVDNIDDEGKIVVAITHDHECNPFTFLLPPVPPDYYQLGSKCQ